MRVSTTALLFLALFAAVAQKKADVQILETKAVREGAKISVDGKVRVTGEKPLRGLVIVFDFRSPEKEVVTSQKAVIDEDTLETGREGVFHSEMADSARAVRYTVRAFDNHDRELRVANPGPYPVE
jgi:P pilus assembly chaperone PapD